MDWITIVIIILVIFVTYLIWSTYINASPLTKVARVVDKKIDEVTNFVEGRISTREAEMKAESERQ